MIAFHGDTLIKQKYLDRVMNHRKADEIIHGKYWSDGKGCAVGCTIHSGDHEAYETELGIPWMIARLEDHLFEAMTNGHALMWPERFLQSVPVGADLEHVMDHWFIWLFTDKTDGVRQLAFDDGQKAIDGIVELYQQRLNGHPPSEAAWAAGAARAAEAAWAAEAAEAAENEKRVLRQADKLLELLAQAPVKQGVA